MEKREAKKMIMEALGLQNHPDYGVHTSGMASSRTKEGREHYAALHKRAKDAVGVANATVAAAGFDPARLMAEISLRGRLNVLELVIYHGTRADALGRIRPPLELQADLLEELQALRKIADALE